MIRQLMAGYAQRITAENELQLRKLKIVRPSQVAAEIAATFTALDVQLADAPFKAHYEKALGLLTATSP